MTEVTGYYARMRDFIQADTVYLALFDSTDTQIGARHAISGGAFSEAGDIVTITKVFYGSNSNFTLPQAIKGTRIYDAATNGNALTALETFTDGTITLRADADELTVTHNINVPQ